MTTEAHTYPSPQQALVRAALPVYNQTFYMRCSTQTSHKISVSFKQHRLTLPILASYVNGITLDVSFLSASCTQYDICEIHSSGYGYQ